MSANETPGRPPDRYSPHRIVNPSALAPPVGFSHAVVAAHGRVVFLGGQTALRPDGSYEGRTVTEQFDRAASNLATVLDAVGGKPEHLTQLTVYVTDVGAYRAALKDIGRAHRRRLGRHYPAMALFGVTALFDSEALVELVGVAVIPE
ncbi:MAG: RidA family protein [Streptosporangiaceae bacterium]